MQPSDAKWLEAVTHARTYRRHGESMGMSCLRSSPCPQCRELAGLIRGLLAPLEREIAAATGGITREWLEKVEAESYTQFEGPATDTAATAPDADPISPLQIAEAERISRKFYELPQVNLTEIPIWARLTGLLVSALRFRDREIERARANLTLSDRLLGECKLELRDARAETQQAVDQAYRDCAHIVHEYMMAQNAEAGLRRARPQAFAAAKPVPEKDPEPSDAVVAALVLQRTLECAAKFCSMCAERKPMLPACHASCVPLYHEVAGDAVHCDAAELRRAYPHAFTEEKPARPPGPPDPPRPKGDDPRG